MYYDLLLFKWLNSWAGINGFLDTVIIFRAVFLVYWMLAGLLVFVVIAFHPKFRPKLHKHLKLAGLAIISGLTARYIITELIRFFYNRPRPFEIFGPENNFVQLLDHAAGGSFPSGHASFAFAIATVVSFYYPKISILFFLAAISTGISRVVAGIHWPSDILGGAIVGIGTAWLVRFLQKKLKKDS